MDVIKNRIIGIPDKGIGVTQCDFEVQLEGCDNTRVLENSILTDKTKICLYELHDVIATVIWYDYNLECL